jgi:hypothetical protein
MANIDGKRLNRWFLLQVFILCLMSAQVQCVNAKNNEENNPPPESTVESGGSISNTWQNTVNSPQFTWNDTPGLEFFIYWGIEATGTDTINVITNTFNPGLVTGGTYYLRINTHNTSATTPDPNNWSTLFVFCYDDTAPGMDSVTAAENSGALDNIWQGTVKRPSFTISGISDSFSGVSGYNVYFGTDPNGTAANLVSGSGITYSPSPASDLADGEYFLRVQGVDHTGNTSGWKTIFTFLLDSSTPDNVTAPAVESHALTTDVWQNSINSPSFTWSASANATRYQVYWGGDPAGTSADESISASYTPASVGAPCVMYLRVRAMNAAGHTSTEWRTLFIYRFDNTTPSAVTSVIEGSGVQSGVCQTNTRTISFSWTAAADTGSGTKGYLYYWGSDPLGIGDHFTDQITFTPNTPKAGAKLYLRMASQDYANNLSAWTTVFIFCHADSLAVVSTNEFTSDPETFTDVDLALPSGLSITLKLSSKSFSEDYYARIWYPEDAGDHTAPSAGYAAPYGYQSFFIGFDAVDDCGTINGLDNQYLITMTYEDADILAIESGQLGIYRQNSSSWFLISSSTQDPADHSVTATLGIPSEVALLGYQIQTQNELNIQAGDISFGSFALTGQSIIRNGITNPWTILNATYTKASWYVTIQASDFIDANNHTISIKNLSLQIPPENIKILISGVSPATLPVSLIQTKTSLSNSPMKILESSAENTTGKYQITPVFKLNIPAETYGGTYHSTITVTIVSGP